MLILEVCVRFEISSRPRLCRKSYWWANLALFSQDFLLPCPHLSFSRENLFCSFWYRYLNKKKISGGSLWLLEWDLVIVSSNDHVNPASDTRHFCAPTLALAYSRDLTDAHMALTGEYSLILIWSHAAETTIVPSAPCLSCLPLTWRWFGHLWNYEATLGRVTILTGWSRPICPSAPFQLWLSFFAVAYSGWHPIFMLVSPWGLPLTPHCSRLHQSPISAFNTSNAVLRQARTEQPLSSPLWTAQIPYMRPQNQSMAPLEILMTWPIRPYYQPSRRPTFLSVVLR